MEQQPSSGKSLLQELLELIKIQADKDGWKDGWKDSLDKLVEGLPADAEVAQFAALAGCSPENVHNFACFMAILCLVVCVDERSRSFTRDQ